MKSVLLIIQLLVLCVFSSQAQSQSTDVKVELITIGPGHFYWEAFGHTALRVKTANADYMYGFGYFDFEDEDFFINFAKGEMQYFMGIQPSQSELADYQSQGREIWSQELFLTSQQKQQLLSILNNLAQPENRYYHYDYFLNNCTSRIRDILDKVTDYDLSSQLSTIQTNKSWNDLTFPAINQAWMNLGIAMGYGLPAYHKRTQWQLSVFPEVFAKDLQNTETKEHWNQPMQVLYHPTEAQQKINSYNLFKTHYAMPLVIFILVLGILWKITSIFTINLWLFIQSLLGFGLLSLWFFTQHTVAAENINVLLLFPLSFVLIFKTCKNKLVLNTFIFLNILWVVLALVFTNLYLIGFLLINVMIWRKLTVNPKL